MDHITVDTLDEFDPQLIELARPIVARWEAAILRVAAAQAQPGLLAFAPRPDTQEGILSKRFRTLPADRQATAGRRAAAALSGPRLRARLGLNGRDLTAPTPIADLIPAAAPQMSRNQLIALVQARSQPAGGPLGAVAAHRPGSLTSLTLEMIRIVCIDETNGFLGTERGQDEIELGCAAFDGTLEVGKSGPFDLGSFDDHGNSRQKDFSPPTVLYTFNLTNASPFPNSFFVTLVLVEADQGNFSETMDEIIAKLQEEVTGYLGTLIGGAIGSAGGPLGTLVGLVVGYAVGKIVNAIVSAWEDDPFTPRTIEVHIPSASATFDGASAQPSQVIHFTGPGEYAMRYRWSTTRVEQPAVFR